MQKHSPSRNLKPYFLVTDDVATDYGGVLDWPVFFGNENPVEIDVGCGRGLFLVQAGEAHRDVNYLGIEIDFREGRRGAARLQKRSLDNVRVLGGDVNLVFTKMIAPHSVQAIHVYFPDPWWKRKHRRRRVFTDRFVNLCSRLLKPGGMLHSWSDVEEYFGVISALMDHREDFETLPPPEERPPEHDMDYRTSYERKKRRAGLPIHRGRWRRKPVSTDGAGGGLPGQGIAGA